MKKETKVITVGDQVFAVRRPRRIMTTEEYRARNVVCEAKSEMVGTLSARVKYPEDKEWIDLGVISKAIVTSAAITELVNVLRGFSATTLQSFKYHASGTSTAVEASTNTALGAEVETREAGSQTSIAVGNYRSVASHTYTGDFAITEHGLFSAASSGTLFDRSKFSPILVSAATAIEWTYDLTIIGT